MFTRSAIADAATRACGGTVRVLSRIEVGQNHSYRVDFADGRTRFLKVGTRFPDRFHAEIGVQRIVGRESRIPVPQVHATGCDPLGYPFAVFEFVEDAEYDSVRKLPPTVADRVCREAGEHQAALHEFTLPEFGHVAVETDDLLVSEARVYRDLIRASFDRQCAELQNTPFADLVDRVADRGDELVERIDFDAVGPTLVHGDYRLDNLCIDPEGDRVTVAVLDWERPMAGDPLWDVVMTLAVLTDGYGIDPDRRGSLRAAFREGYGDFPTDSARWDCYELLARMRLARHVGSEMTGEPASARATRVEEHVEAFETLLDRGATLR
ncbi:MAG: phosphotransferase family protein [Halopenitus sp.]